MSHTRQFEFSLIPALVCLALLGAMADSASGQALWKDFEWTETFEGPVQIEAEQLTLREDEKHLLLSGGVHLLGDGIDMRAEWMEMWSDTSKVVMAGSVRVVDGNSVLLCERLEFSRKAGTALLQQATVLVKQDASMAELSKCRTASGLEAEGFNAIRLEGQRWIKLGGQYLIEKARFTPCDCGPDEAPSFEIRAQEADVVPDDRAWLTWPILFLKGVPVLAMPVGYLPLGRRKTGLLFPEINYSGRDGWVLSESLFVTLGESADTTVSADWIQERGFRQRLEVRAVPFERSWIAARFSHIDDQKAADAAEEGKRAGRHRYTGELDAWIDGPSGFGIRADAHLYSDSDINRDFVSDMSGRAADYAPTSLAFQRRGQNGLLGLDFTYRQDLRAAAVDLFSSADARVLERLGSDPVGDTIQRLGVFEFHLVDSAVFGWPLRFSLFAECANLSSLQAAWRDWGVDGTPDPREPRYDKDPAEDYSADNGPYGEGDGQLSHGELRRAVRLLLEPWLRLPLRLGRVLELDFALGHRQRVYIPHGPLAPDSSTAGNTFASVGIGTQLSRTFGQGTEKIAHEVSPWIKLAGALQGLKSPGPKNYLDLNDRLANDALQLLVGFDTKLFQGSFASGYRRLVGLQLTQGVDLLEGRLAQATVALDLNLFPVVGRAALAFDWSRLELSEADVGLGFRDGRGDALRVSYLYLPSSIDDLGRPLPFAERTQRELGLLFGDTPQAYRAMGASLHVMDLSLRIAIAWGLSLVSGVNLNLKERLYNWYGGGFSYSSNCRCWSVAASFRMLRGQDIPDFFVFLDLAYLGSARAGTSAKW